ncbi:MAG TPA: sigma-70 family RNA polymerase sigma factor [Bryobacteraceae bacterium]|nr:sigma-70 family RNA polymerase sigma factor [Bryobacteraceae bacterium]
MVTTQDADAELVASAQGGDSAAFTCLVDRHYSSSLKLAQSILRNTADAEDEVQNSFTKVFLHLGRFEGNSRFSTWLGRIVVNQCLMRLRSIRRSRLVYLDEPDTDAAAPRLELSDPAETPEQMSGRREMESAVWREMRAIPQLLREPFLLRQAQQMSLAGIAAQLDISEPAAKSRLLRARRELRTRLLRYQGRRGIATLL